MSAWSLLELSPEPQSARAATGPGTDIETLRGYLLDAESEIVDLNRRITAAIVAKQATGGLSSELHDIIEARDFMKARLARLEGERHG
jgi:hypothetical protein